MDFPPITSPRVFLRFFFSAGSQLFAQSFLRVTDRRKVSSQAAANFRIGYCFRRFPEQRGAVPFGNGHRNYSAGGGTTAPFSGDWTLSRNCHCGLLLFPNAGLAPLKPRHNEGL